MKKLIDLVEQKSLESIEDIYRRKISAAAGRTIPTGRQSVKDLFDLYCLSKRRQPLSEFFFEYFSYDKAEALIAWYRGFNRMNLKIELLELVPKVDTARENLSVDALKRVADAFGKQLTIQFR